MTDRSLDGVCSYKVLVLFDARVKILGVDCLSLIHLSMVLLECQCPVVFPNWVVLSWSLVLLASSAYDNVASLKTVLLYSSNERHKERL